jgi:hypothetical protein
MRISERTSQRAEIFGILLGFAKVLLEPKARPNFDKFGGLCDYLRACKKLYCDAIDESRYDAAASVVLGRVIMTFNVLLEHFSGENTRHDMVSLWQFFERHCLDERGEIYLEVKSAMRQSGTTRGFRESLNSEGR